MEVNSLDSALTASRILARTYPVAVVTAGGEGVAAFEQEGGKDTLIPAIKVKLISTHGAGDEFIGVLAAQLLQGAAINTALARANEAAAILVNTPRA